ncbi:hypothetical protein SAPIO_CDS4909 [Scedosporium apiospermum]|uniref:Heterokaryon incompatibility domain-containing protein n=1 Tax=Pseudallescheria apiosperma TaxID=563466 RepID=A0A084G7B6_PSEDA|nr:uncharacterized protein SAPIO_CDS4909 [Scedosporium apiospermum]KEZ43228.1 hypothetical protein SAPIO_CDS4909 [Scedosporium apiospermum]
MRLLHTTNLEVVSFVGDPPRYAILSHTWEDEEVSLQDLYPGGKGKQMKGYAKLQDSSALAASQGYEYIWTDTCCIDKTSSAELSEAINSMFRWYQEAGVCYAFLNDVSTTSSIVDSATAGSDEDAILREVVAARWFTRGWTLQELIAPKALHFFNRNRAHLGSKDEATRAINLAAGIPPEAFLGSDLSEISSFSGLLAEDPSWFTASAFRLKGNLSPIPLQDPSATITNKGVNLRWAILRVTNDPACALHIAMLAQSGDTSGGIVIQQLDEDGSDFCRVLPGSAPGSLRKHTTKYIHASKL